MSLEIKFYRVTELNTRKKKYDNFLKDIFEGDDYKYHDFKTIEEARAFKEELKKQGISTNLTQHL